MKAKRPAPTTSAQETAAVPTAAELTGLLDRASDPAVPVEEKVDLVEGGAEAPEIFDQIAALKADGVLPFANFNRIHVCPPCTISDDEAREGLAILDAALEVADAAL